MQERFLWFLVALLIVVGLMGLVMRSGPASTQVAAADELELVIAADDTQLLFGQPLVTLKAGKDKPHALVGLAALCQGRIQELPACAED